MIYTNGSDIDLGRYKRFFAFGCSFTGYRWPTWADLLAHSNSKMEYINMARSGAGQLFIIAQLNQCINHYNIGKDDLVGIMWSTFYREDRYLYHRRSDNWSTPGNIFTARHEVPQEFVDEYVCTRGMFVRDLALIDTTMRMLEHSDFDSFAMMGVSPENQNWTAGLEPGAGPPVDDVINLYSRVDRNMMPSLLETQFPDGWDTCYRYWNEGLQDIHADYHPSVRQYAVYLKKLGFKLPEHTQNFVREEHDRLLNVTHENELEFHSPCMIL